MLRTLIAVSLVLVTAQQAISQVQPRLIKGGVGGGMDPVLNVNGVSSVDNSGVVHLTRGAPLDILLTGSPGHSFGLFLSASANTAINDGFYLTVWQPDGTTRSPIHPALDGIGSDVVAGFLPGVSVSDFVGGLAAPPFQFDVAGSFRVLSRVPSRAVLVDTDPAGLTGPTIPIIFPLESSSGNTVRLFLQIVSLDPSGQDFRIGNGMELIFDQLLFSGTVLYSEGQDSNPNSSSMGSLQTLGRLGHADLSNDVPSGLDQSNSEFSGAGFPGNLDVWMVTLAGFSEVVNSSVPPNAPHGSEGDPGDPNSAYATIHGYSSGLEFLTGARPERNNENREYPRIALPGNRELFHWRKGGATPEYGFGVLFKDSGRFRNLTPPGSPGGPFTESSTRSPWEIEVGVSPDGDRAIAVLDRGSASFDSIYVFNLEEGLNFSNGFPLMDVTPPSGLGRFRRSFEESIAFVGDGLGGWVGFIESSDVSSTALSLYPDYLWRIDTDNGSIFQVLPFGTITPTRLDRNTFVSEDHNTLCVIGGTEANQENVFSVTAVTKFSHALIPISAFSSDTKLMESTNASNGQGGFSHLSRDGSVFAFARADGTKSFPMVARTNGADAGDIADLVEDVAMGGRFDTLSDFSHTQDLFVTDDNRTLLFFQGLLVSGAAVDRLDLFSYRLSDGLTHNLTRTISGTAYSGGSTLAYLGPWDLPAVSAGPDRPRFDPAGAFVTRDRGHRFYLRGSRDVGGQPDVLNLVAVSLREGDEFELTNVTGTEFEPRFGASPPTSGAPDVKALVFASVEQTGGRLRIRRVGGTGPFQDWYYMTALLSVPATSSESINEHLFLFDGAHPGPALQITHHGVNSPPFSVPNGTTITSVTPSQVDAKVAYILNRAGSGSAATQELVVQDLGGYGTQVRIPNPGSNPTFNRSITAGSLHWRKTAPTGLAYVSGTIVRPAGSGAGGTDGISTGIDVNNPINATPYFFTFEKPTIESRLAGAPVGSNRRAAFIWGLQ